jgi:hypothetical protein
MYDKNPAAVEAGRRLCRFQPPGLTPPVAPAPPDFEVGLASPAGVSGADVAGGVVGVGVGAAGVASDFGASLLVSPRSPPVVGGTAGAPFAASPAPLFGLVAAGGGVAVVSIVLSEVSVCEVEPEELDVALLALLAAAASLARSFSTCIAEVMKLCQISAGNVPPNTGPPSKSVVIGTRLLG